MPTPISSLTPYATGTDMVQRYDVRWLGDRLQDQNLRVSSSNVPGDPNLAALLADASGMIEAACFRGQKYTVADLQTLTGNSLAYLKRLTCDLVIWLLFNRRPMAGQQIPIQAQDAKNVLYAIEGSILVFGLQAKMTAGVHIPVLTPTGTALFKPQPISQRVDRMFGDIPFGPGIATG